MIIDSCKKVQIYRVPREDDLMFKGAVSRRRLGTTALDERQGESATRFS